MASTFTPSLRLNLQDVGDNPSTWGTVANDGVFKLVEQAVAGYLAIDISVASGTGFNYTLTSNDGAPDESRPMILNFTGALTGNTNVIVPDVTKFYLIVNSTTGSFTTTVKPVAASGVVINQGTRRLIYCDGINVLPGDPVAGAGTVGFGTAAAPSYSAFEDTTTGYNILSAGVLTMATSSQEAVRVNTVGTGFGTTAINSRINISGRVQATPIALTSGATINWDLNLGNVFTLVLDTNATLANPTNMVSGTYYALYVQQDSTGSRTLSYGSAYSWGNIGIPVLTSAPNKVDLMLFYCNGTKMLGTVNYGFDA